MASKCPLVNIEYFRDSEALQEVQFIWYSQNYIDASVPLVDGTYYYLITLGGHTACNCSIPYESFESKVKAVKKAGSNGLNLFHLSKDPTQNGALLTDIDTYALYRFF